MINACVYIVDPDKTDRNALAEQLKSVYYKTETLSSGKDVLRKVKRNGRHIVILDLDLEDMDAFDLITQLRKKNGDLQVITITRNATSKIRKKTAKLGVLFHSTKPKHLYQLRNIVDVTLEFEARRDGKAVG